MWMWLRGLIKSQETDQDLIRTLETTLEQVTTIAENLKAENTLLRDIGNDLNDSSTAYIEQLQSTVAQLQYNLGQRQPQ